MPLVSSKQLLLDAQRGKYAVGAFNFENMEMAQAVIEAAEQTGSPALLATTPSTVRYASAAVFSGMISAMAARSHAEIALHLDHGNSLELVAQALAAGYTSLMMDGSALDFEENVTVTRKAVDLAGGRVPVEGELGRVGGKEDDLEAEADANTDPGQAADFVRRTGADSLAVGIGTAHGFYVKTPVLDKARLSEIRAVVDVPLVLHGASGLSDEDVRDCIARGICKVNFATELRVAYTEGVRQALREDPKLIDPKAFGAAGKRRVKELVIAKMILCARPML